MKHHIFAKEEGSFLGWPANGGIWIWGDEILVGFGIREYQEKAERHSINLDVPGRNGLARSIDGGETWSLEIPPELNEKPDSGPCPGGLDFTHPDFCMTVRGGAFYVSFDRGKTWPAVYRLPTFDEPSLDARTDYFVEDSASCTFSLTAAKRNGKEGRPFCARTADGGRTIDFLGWITPEPNGYAIMPSTVRVGDACLVSAVRRHEGEGDGQTNWIEIWDSTDGGRNWNLVCDAAADTGLHGGNPPSMVRLADGRLCLTYGRRKPPFGIRARFSSSGGASWSEEVILRDDARTWDIGYPRTVIMGNGELLTLYYYSTETDREQHIAGTRWSP